MGSGLSSDWVKYAAYIYSVGFFGVFIAALIFLKRNSKKKRGDK